MLLRIGVANYQSIREYSELNLVASSSIKDDDGGLISAIDDKIRVLPIVLVYGANASGKSTLHNVMGSIQNHVLNSFVKRTATAPIIRSYFALDNESKNKPTIMDCDFVIEGTRYHFGFEYNNESYLKEWLYSFPEGHRRTLYLRGGGQEDIYFGKSLKGRNKIIEDLTRPNSLFLSAAAQNSHPQLTEIYNFFATQVMGVGVSVNNSDIEKEISTSDHDKLVKFLNIADTGIAGVAVSKKEPNELEQKMFKALRQTMMEEMPDAVEAGQPLEARASVRFLHRGKDGVEKHLPFHVESRGTRRVASLALKCFKAIETGSVIFIDELDASLHTLLTSKIIDLFKDRAVNSKGAQLIATTHDTNLLCMQNVRRDEIWFVEKSKSGETCIYPLTDIKTRNSDNLEKGYLQGRFGAVPYMGDVTSLFGGGDVEA